MKKEKKEVHFNPDDYDYMDVMPLEGWFWEIIRKSQDYKNAYNKINDYGLGDIQEHISAFIHQTRILPTVISFKAKPNLSKRREYLFKRYKHIFFFAQFSTITNFRTKKEYKEFVFLGIPAPDFKYSDFPSDYKPKLWGCSPIVCKSNDPYLKLLINQMPIDNMLFAILPLTISSTYIERGLLPSIRNYLQPRKIRIRTDKWKDYLIVYDLKKEHLTYKEIADSIINVSPEKKRLFDEKNIENYYKNALELINGGYKKYLPF